jgi:hypothetical protein
MHTPTEQGVRIFLTLWNAISSLGPDAGFSGGWAVIYRAVLWLITIVICLFMVLALTKQWRRQHQPLPQSQNGTLRLGSFGSLDLKFATLLLSGFRQGPTA